jgi:hypothetical protein
MPMPMEQRRSNRGIPSSLLDLPAPSMLRWCSRLFERYSGIISYIESVHSVDTLRRTPRHLPHLRANAYKGLKQVLLETEIRRQLARVLLQTDCSRFCIVAP